MPEPIEEVRVRVSAETAAFVSQVDNAVNKGTKKLGTFGGIVKQVGANWAALGASIGTAIAGFVSYRALQGAISYTEQLGEAVHTLNEQTGMGAEASSKLLYAGQHYGLQVEDLTRSLGILAKKLKGVQDEETGVTTGGKSTAQILGDMGIKATDVGGMLLPMTDLLPQIADYFKTLPDGVEKTGLAMQLFGRGGRDMIEFLNAGAAGIAELGAAAQRLGLVLSEDNVAAIKKYMFAQTDWKQAVGGLKLMIGMELMPVLTRFTKWLLDIQPDMRRFTGDLLSGAAAVVGFATGAAHLAGAVGPLSQSFVVMAAAVAMVAIGLATVNIVEYLGELVEGRAAVVAFTASTNLATGAWAAFKVVVGTLPGLLAVVAGAILLIDQGLRVFTGSGILAWIKKFADGITGAGAAAERTATAVRQAGDATAYYNAMMAEGASTETARTKTLVDFTNKAAAAVAAQERAAASVDAGATSFGAYQKIALDTAASLEAYANTIKAMPEPLTFPELQAITAQVPRLAQYLQPELAAAAAGFQALHPELKITQQGFLYVVSAATDAAAAIGTVGKSAGDLAQQLTDTDAITKSLEEVVLPAFASSLEELKLKERQNELQALADTLGKSFPLERQQELDTVTNKLGLLGRKSDEVKLQLQEMGLRFVTAFGPEAGAKYQEVLDFISSIPAEKVVEVFPLLNAMSAQKIVNFMALYRAGFTNIPVTFALAGLNIAPATAAAIQSLPFGMGKGMMAAVGAIGAVQMKAVDTGLDVEKMAGQFTGAAEDAAKAADKFTDMTQSLDDLTTTLLGLGRAAGMSDSQLAGYPWTLELARRAAERLGLTTDDLLNIFQATGSGFADFMRELAASEALDNLKKQADAVGAALDDLRSQFSALFGKPTREEAQINYRLAQLKLQRAQMVAAGASDEAMKGIDKEIKQIGAVVDVRGAEKDVLRSQLDMADKTLLSDAAQLSQGRDLVSKMADLSAAAAPVIALYQTQAAMMQTWMDSLANLVYIIKAIPPATAQIPAGTPSMASGGIVPGPTGQPRLILAHGGEPILPAGMPFSFAMPITLNIQGAPDWMEIARQAHQAVTDALHQARTQTYLGGAPVGAGIG